MINIFIQVATTTAKASDLLVDPGVDGLVVGKDTLGEPESNLLLSTLDTVRSMANVTANINAKVTTDGSGEGGKRVGLSEDLATSLDGILAGEDHAEDGAAGHEGDEAVEEALAGEVRVVGLEVLLGGGSELGGEELVATLLETGKNLTNLSITIH